MNQKQILNLTKEELDEYFTKREISNELKKEVEILSKKIKYEMGKVGRREINIHGYKIDLEIKYEHTNEFFELLMEKGLSYLISKGITPTHFKSAIRQLKIEDDSIYMKEKETKWLHIYKDVN